MISVESLQPGDARVVARLHQQNLNTGFSGRAGFGLLEAYYRGLARSSGACGYVAKRDSLVIGFVCGVWDESATQRNMMRREWGWLLLWGSVFALAYPSRLFKRLTAPGGEPPTPEGRGYELRPIVVAPEARGSGSALALVRRLAEDARGRGFPRIHLYTELDNTRAQQFYLKAGFREVGREVVDGRPCARFELQV